MARSTSPFGKNLGAGGRHLDALRAAGIPPESEAALVAYLDLLAQWGPRVNLTGARTPEERVSTLVAPVLPLVPLVPEARVLDLGSGNGSPGLVLALLRPTLEVTLVEPRVRRVAFLREAARAAGRSGVEVFHGRHQDYPGPPAETVLVRALRVSLPELQVLTAPRGLAVVMGRAPEGTAAFVAEPSPRPDLHLYRRST